MTSKNLSFEAAFNELNQLVEEMEKGGLPLEDALKKFEHGIELTRFCQKSLADAEQKVQMLTQNEAGSSLEPYELPSDERP